MLEILIQNYDDWQGSVTSWNLIYLNAFSVQSVLSLPVILFVFISSSGVACVSLLRKSMYWFLTRSTPVPSSPVDWPPPKLTMTSVTGSCWPLSCWRSHGTVGKGPRDWTLDRWPSSSLALTSTSPTDLLHCSKLLTCYHHHNVFRLFPTGTADRITRDCVWVCFLSPSHIYLCPSFNVTCIPAPMSPMSLLQPHLFQELPCTIPEIWGTVNCKRLLHCSAFGS